MAQVGKLKFEDQDLYMHYTEYEGETWFISDSNEERTEFYKSYDKFEFLFDLKGGDYLPVKLDVNEDAEFTKALFEKMLNDNNSYFKEYKDSFISIKINK